MSEKRLKELCAGAVLFASILAILCFTAYLPPGTDRSLHRTIGTALARQALAVGGPGAQIVIITRDTEAFPQPALAVLEQAFQSEARGAGASIVKRQEIQSDPLRPVEVPPGDFFEQIRRAPAGHVIVSFLGPPLLTPEQWNQLGVIQPKIVAFCSGRCAEQIDLAQLLESGRLHAAVVGKSGTPERTARPGTRHTFEQLYQTVTATDRSSLERRSNLAN